MNNFYENIQAKGWDNFISSIEKEFITIKEDLCISTESMSEITILHAKAISKNDFKSDLNIKSTDDIIKEFTKIREELNISSLDI